MTAKDIAAAVGVCGSTITAIPIELAARHVLSRKTCQLVHVDWEEISL